MLLFLVASCGAINPEAPLETTVDIPEPTDLPTSVINIPIRMDLKGVFSEANKEIPTDFNGGAQTCEGVSYKYNFKREPIDFVGKGSSLEFNINGKYALNLNYCPKCSYLFGGSGNCVIPRVSASCGVDEPMRKVFISYRSKISLTENYRLSAKTTLNKVNAVSPCKITVFDYNATEQIEEELRVALKEVERDIDKELGSFDLKPELEPLWKSLSEPQDLQGYGFLMIQPESVSMSAMKFKGDSVYFDLQLAAKPRVKSDRKTSTPAKKLPALCDYKKTNGFDLTVDMALDYDSLTVILQRNLGGLKTIIKGKEVIVDSVSIESAVNEQISLQLKFSGKKKGTLYLLGTPVFNDSLQQISFPDLTYDLKTKNALLRSAKWLFDSKITETLRKEATFNLTENLAQLIDMIIQQMNSEIQKGVFLKGEVSSLNISHVYPKSKELLIRMKAKGKAELRM